MDHEQWSELIDEHVRWLAAREYAQSTVRSRRHQLIRYAAWSMGRGGNPLDSHTLCDLEAYRLHLHELVGERGARLGQGSRIQMLLAVKGLYRWLTLVRRIPSNPAADLQLPRRDQCLPRGILSALEVERILDQPDTSKPIGLRDRAIMELLYSTGIRRSECAALRLGDLDPSRGSLLVRLGKGRRDRYVPVGERASQWIGRYVARGRTSAGGEPSADELFLSRRGSPLSPKRIGHLVHRYVAMSGTRSSGACHLFRHAMATLMLEGGADIRHIQAILGHASLATTALYARVSIDHLREVHRRCHPASVSPNSRQAPRRIGPAHEAIISSG
jgi:integrase/recombinase XerD